MTSAFASIPWQDIPFHDASCGWFAIVDCCDAPEIQDLVHDEEMKARCLWKGSKGNDYWSIAPYLVAITHKTSKSLHSIATTDDWGFIFTSKRNEQEIFEHFRRFALVTLPHGQIAYFRFYDPRVLATFIEKSDPKDIRKFLEVIDTLFIPNRHGFMKYTSSILPI